MLGVILAADFVVAWDAFDLSEVHRSLAEVQSYVGDSLGFLSAPQLLAEEGG
jgi:hypothetical protein